MIELNDKTDKQLFEMEERLELRIQEALDIGGFSHDIEDAENALEAIYFELKQRGWKYQKNQWKNTETGEVWDWEQDEVVDDEYDGNLFIPDSFAECGFCHVCGDGGKALNADCMCVLCWRDES